MKFIPYLQYYLCIFIITSFLPHKSLCAHPQYEACVPKYCGSHRISFPFYIEDEQESYCGYPGFNLTCINNDYPIIEITQDEYRVDEILYGSRSLRVSNAALWSSNPSSDVCSLPQIRNLTLQGDRFELSNNLSLVLLMNCSWPLPDQLRKYIVGCGNWYDEEDRGNWGLAMNWNDTNLSFGIKEWKVVTVAPVLDDHVYESSSNNHVELLRKGFDLKWTASDCGHCEASGGHCGFDAGYPYSFKCYCPDRPHSRICKPSRKRSMRLILGTVIPGAVLIICLVIIIIWRSKKYINLIPMIVGTAAACVVILIVLLCCFWSKCSYCKTMIFGKYRRKDHENIEAFLRKYGPLAPKRYRYQDVKKMTNSFKCKLGQGGYGGVYKGKLHDGRDVAVKLLNKQKGEGEEFVNEVASISRTSHVNIVTLLGFCLEGSKRALIYEFMPNGSLEKFIPNEKSTAVRQLGWETLYQIALGIARGLEYLHRGCNTRILHFDIKPHNILLDEEFCPKISDFGLAKLCFGKDSVISMLGMRGTPGYIAPEVFSRNFGAVSHKSDVYSYGMMILEMVGERKNNGVDRSTEEYFPEWIYNRLELNAEIGLEGISNEVENGSTRKMIIVGLWCIQADPSNRPSMKRVLEMLEGGLESLQIPPRPFFVSVPEPLPYSSTT